VNTINEALRAHVTSAKFVLTLGATHIAALVHIDRELCRNRTIDEDLADGTLTSRSHYPDAAHPLRRAFRHNATGVGGCIARGLITHTPPAGGAPGTWTGHIRPDQIWTITPAGRAVITLLVEAGIWAEYDGALAPIEENQPEPAVPTRRRGRAAA
jgi:hypothetical protein